MGLVVSASYLYGNTIYDSFYSRIEVYTIRKDVSNIQMKIGYYLDSQSAIDCSEEYPDEKDRNYFGKILPEFWNPNKTYHPIVSGSIDTGSILSGAYEPYEAWHDFPLTGSKTYNRSYISESVTVQMVDYVDFDEDGNEITGSREEVVVTQTPVTESIVRNNVYQMTQVSGSIFDFGYQKIKEKFIQRFGSENVFDL